MMMAKTFSEAAGPPSSQAQRRDIPDYVFLLVTGSGEKKVKRFPAKAFKNGRWVWSYRWLNAARNRAMQYGYRAVFNKATKQLNKLRRERYEEPLLYYDAQKRKNL